MFGRRFKQKSFIQALVKGVIDCVFVLVVAFRCVSTVNYYDCLLSKKLGHYSLLSRYFTKTTPYRGFKMRIRMMLRFFLMSAIAVSTLVAGQTTGADGVEKTEDGTSDTGVRPTVIGPEPDITVLPTDPAVIPEDPNAVTVAYVPNETLSWEYDADGNVISYINGIPEAEYYASQGAVAYAEPVPLMMTASLEGQETVMPAGPDGEPVLLMMTATSEGQDALPTDPAVNPPKPELYYAATSAGPKEEPVPVMMTATSEGQEGTLPPDAASLEPKVYYTAASAGPDFEYTKSPVADPGPTTAEDGEPKAVMVTTTMESQVPQLYYADSTQEESFNPEDPLPVKALAGPGGTLGGEEECPFLPGCCEEDCCGQGTLWQSPFCVLDPSSAGFNGTHSSEWNAGCIERACCESNCCIPGTVYDSSKALCVPA